MKYSKVFKVTDNMCGLYQTIKPSGVLDLLQGSAGEHANMLGIGYEDMKAKGYAFVLARVKFDLFRQIERYEEVIVETTPLIPGRIDFDRDFEIYDAKTKDKIAIATTKWIIIDLNTRRICRSSVFEYPCDMREVGNYDSFDKLSFDKDELTRSYDYEVRHNDVDFLGHMNNTKYADALILDKACKHFEINFIKETTLGEKLTIHHDDNNFVGYCGDSVSFKASVIYF